MVFAVTYIKQPHIIVWICTEGISSSATGRLWRRATIYMPLHVLVFIYLSQCEQHIVTVNHLFSYQLVCWCNDSISNFPNNL